MTRRRGRSCRFGRVGTTIAALVAVVGVSACSGPRQSIEVGIKELPSDVLLADGQRLEPGELAQGIDLDSPIAPVVISAMPPLMPSAPGIPGPGTPPPPRFVTKEAVCPDAKAGAKPLPAPPTIAAPPEAVTRIYRMAGKFHVFFLNGLKNESSYPAESMRTVLDIDNTPEVGDSRGFHFSVADDTLLGGRNTTRFYVSDTGVYITDITRTTPRGTETVFTPDVPTSLRILPLPASAGATSNGVATDSAPGRQPRVIRYSANTVGKVALDACGVLVEAWQVNVNGIYEDPNANTNLGFSLTYDIGTQFGGLIMAESVAAGCKGDPHAVDPQSPSADTLSCTMNSNRVELTSRAVADLDAGPVPTVSPPSISARLVDVPVTGKATFAGGTGPYTCKVDYGDGSGEVVGVVDGRTCTGPPHTYERGIYRLVVLVTDASGVTGAASLGVEMPEEVYSADAVGAERANPNYNMTAPRNAFDGYTSTRWASLNTPGNHWLQVEFVRTRQVTGVFIQGGRPANLGAEGGHTVLVDFDISTAVGDGPLEVRKTITGNDKQDITVTFDRPVQADTLRITVKRSSARTKRAGDPPYSDSATFEAAISEVTVLGR